MKAMKSLHTTKLRFSKTRILRRGCFAAGARNRCPPTPDDAKIRGPLPPASFPVASWPQASVLVSPLLQYLQRHNVSAVCVAPLCLRLLGETLPATCKHASGTPWNETFYRTLYFSLQGLCRFDHSSYSLFDHAPPCQHRGRLFSTLAVCTGVAVWNPLVLL